MEETNKSRPEEIDLFTFLKPLWDAIVYIFKAFATFCKLVYSNIGFVMMVTLISGIIGFSLRYILPKAYQSEAVIVTHELPAKLCVILLENLEELVKNKPNKTVLARKLGLTNEQAYSVIDIRSQLTKDSFFVNDRDTMRNFFTIHVIYKDSSISSALQNGIVNYLENNNYALKRREAKRKSLLSLKANLDLKLKSLDSLKQIVNNSIVPRSQGQGIILGEPVDPVGVYQAEVAYFKEQLFLDESLVTIDNVEIVQPFITTSKPNYPRFNIILLYFIGGGFLLSIIGIFFRKKDQV